MPLPKRSEWKAPWQVDKDGKDIPKDDQVVDPDKLADHLYNLLGDKEKLQVRATGAEAKVSELEKAVESKSTEGLSEIEKLTASVEALTKRAETAEFEKTKLDVITSKKLKPEAAEFLKGATEAELEASADKLLELGLGEKSGTDGKEGKVDDQGNPITTQPVVKNRINSGDPQGGSPKELSVDDFVKSFEEQSAGPFSL